MLQTLPHDNFGVKLVFDDEEGFDGDDNAPVKAIDCAVGRRLELQLSHPLPHHCRWADNVLQITRFLFAVIKVHVSAAPGAWALQLPAARTVLKIVRRLELDNGTLLLRRPHGKERRPRAEARGPKLGGFTAPVPWHRETNRLPSARTQKAHAVRCTRRPVSAQRADSMLSCHSRQDNMGWMDQELGFSYKLTWPVPSDMSTLALERNPRQIQEPELVVQQQAEGPRNVCLDLFAETASRRHHVCRYRRAQ